jgi:cytidine deaminase
MKTDPFRPGDEPLLAKARDALQHAHAPYSRFRVGAAAADANGRIHVGTNIENASYGLTMCAERVAIFSAVAAGARQLTTLALSIETAVNDLRQTMPCGACRQVMAEFMTDDARVLVDRVGCFALAELLPLAFRLTPPV